MRIQSSAETVTAEDGAVLIAFDLAESEAAYLVISLPAEDGDPKDSFGADHYVEVQDQLFGSYGGIESLAVVGESELMVRLSAEVPGVGRVISIRTSKPFESELLRHLRRLEQSCPIGAGRR